MVFQTIILMLSVIVGLASILLGIYIIGRCEGKLKICAVLLVLGVIILLVSNGIVALELTGSAINGSNKETDPDIIKTIINLSLHLVIFGALFNIKRMIVSIDNKTKITNKKK